MKDMTFADRAIDAAKAGTATRERQIESVRLAYMSDVTEARNSMALTAELLTARHLPFCRHAIESALLDLDELARLIAQRDGYDEAQSIGPDVAR
jgi:hypothetical protein